MHQLSEKAGGSVPRVCTMVKRIYKQLYARPKSVFGASLQTTHLFGSMLLRMCWFVGCS